MTRYSGGTGHLKNYLQVSTTKMRGGRDRGVKIATLKSRVKKKNKTDLELSHNMYTPTTHGNKSQLGGWHGEAKH